MSGWLPIATRGCLALDVLTFRRARAERIFLLDCHFLLRVKPDGDAEPIDIRSPTAESVRSWIREMEPHTLQILVAVGEDADAVRAAIEGRMQ